MAVRKYVFKSKKNIYEEILKYGFLAFFLISSSSFLVSFITLNLKTNIYLTKLFVESLLFLASFSIQRIFVFADLKSYDWFELHVCKQLNFS